MRRSEKTLGILSLLAIAALGLAGGCGDKLTYEHFSLIRPQATVDFEVEEFIGEPDDKVTDRWIYSRHDRDLTVIVTFGKDRVVKRKEWIDGERWEDSGDKTDRKPGSESIDSLKTYETD
jgi:hypothetical protein